MSNNPYAPPESPTTVPTRSHARTDGPSGLGGWLIVLGLSLMLGLVIRFFGLLQNSNVLVGPEWKVLTSPGNAAYDPWWGPGIIIEIVMLAALLLLNLYVLFVYFTKRQLFPLIFLIFCLTNILVSIIDFVICSMIHNFPDQAKGSLVQAIVQSLIYTAIWGLYVMKSVRVKNTFVR